MTTMTHNQSTPVRLAFDIDFTMTTGENHQKVFGTKYPGFDIDKHYDIYPIEDALIKYGFEKEGFNRLEVYQEYTEELFAVSPLESWFLHVYNHLKDLPNVELHFITARNQGYEQTTKRLFDHYNIPFKNVYHLGGYHKEDLITKLNISAIFEDNLATVLRVLEECPDCHTFLVERLYNKTNTVHPRLTYINPKDNPEGVLQKVLDIIEKAKEIK